MEASLTCAVCLSLFEEPVTLPLCSHNFCRGCVLECLASAEAARLQQQQQPRGPGQPRLSRAAPGLGAGGGAGAARVPCPLCRKLCPLPRGGAAALPVNTTLAEVVKLYRAGAVGEAEHGLGPGPLCSPALGGSCQKHPGRPVQLYCRMCCQAGCGQCVSEEHQGIFHSVNLIDTVYQEEKLTFFSSLKKMRVINEKLTNEISSQPNDMDMVLNKDEKIIVMGFVDIYKTLELKKQQLLEEVENQKSKKEKEFQIWKKMKETHKKTIENFLTDCEKLVHECDPQRFLEVACGLNTRMKTQLDLMSIASSYEKPPEYIQKRMDIAPVVQEILALKLVPAKDLPSGENGNSTKNMLVKNNGKPWQEQNTPNAFLPVAGQEEALADGSRICTRFMSISEMSAFQNMSHEELRYQYYVECQKITGVFKSQTVPANKKYKFVTAEALKEKPSGTSSVSSPTNMKMGTLEKADGFERSFSGGSNRSIPSTSANFPETNDNVKLFHERCSQDAAALTENNNLTAREKPPVQASVGTVCNEMETNSMAASGLTPGAVAADISNSECIDVSADTRSASPFAFSACNNALPRFIKDAGMFSFKKKDKKYVFPQFYLGKCDRTNSQEESKSRKHDPAICPSLSDAPTQPTLDSADSEKPVFLFSSSERDCCAGSGVSNIFKALPLPSFLSQSEKPSERNASCHMMGRKPSANEAVECGAQKASVSGEQKANASDTFTTAARSATETNTAPGVNDLSKSPTLPSNCVFSFKSDSLSFLSPVFSFGSVIGNTSSAATSSVLSSGSCIEKAEKEKMKPDRTVPAPGKPVSPECAAHAARHSHPKREGSFLPVNCPKKAEGTEMLTNSNFCSQHSCSVFPASSAQQPTAPKQEAEVRDERSVTAAENNSSCSRWEDSPEPVQFPNAACSVLGSCSESSSGGSGLTVREAGGGKPSDTDSDTEELSQASAATDTSSTSEYFSVAEDKQPT